MSAKIQIIMIDNYDSFTYNLVDQFRQFSAKVVVFRNTMPLTKIFTSQRLQHKNTLIVISPGPGNPDSAGNCLQILKDYVGKLPILGICLGHQAIIQHYGGHITHAKNIMHGKADTIYFNKDSIFSTLETPFRAARYHSLIGKNIPDNLKIIATSKASDQQETMAVVDDKNKVLGFQFHPESILTIHGSQLLKLAIDYLTKKSI